MVTVAGGGSGQVRSDIPGERGQGNCSSLSEVRSNHVREVMGSSSGYLSVYCCRRVKFG